MSANEPANYVKIWLILVALLVVSVLGPMLEIQIVTLVTAFGIAIVKAYLVAKNFMHVNVERKHLHRVLVTAIALMVLLFYGVAPDVMEHEGQHWENVAAKKEVASKLAEIEKRDKGESQAATH